MSPHQREEAISYTVVWFESISNILSHSGKKVAEDAIRYDWIRSAFDCQSDSDEINVSGEINANKILVAAAEDRLAFDAARSLAAVLLRDSGSLPRDLAHFVADILVDEVSRPKGQGPQSSQNRIRDICIFEAVEKVCSKFGLRPTRNQASEHKDSACDIVAEALLRCETVPRLGKTPASYKRVVEIWRTSKADVSR